MKMTCHLVPILGLDALKAKRDKRKERKQRAKSRKKTLKSSGQIVTLASQLKSTPPAQVVKYEDPRKRSKKREEKIASERGESILQKEEVTMKAARFDVFKFGLSGFGKEDREDAEVARLIRLGAKPAKNKCLPYAEFKERQKKEKEEERKRKEVQRLSGMTTAGKRKANSAAGVKEQKGKKKKKAGSDSIQSKVGKFDGGMLRLSAKDLAKIKGGK